MRRILRKIKQFVRIIGAILYLLYFRIKNIGKPKGIAQVVDSFNSGGLEQVAANLYRAFKNNNDPSFVITVSNNVGPMCQQLNSPAHLRIIYYDIVDMIRYCAKNNIRTLIFHFTTFHFIFLKLLGFRNYYIIHNTYLWYTEKEWKHLKTKLRFASGIIAVSEWCKEYFVKKTGIYNVKVILNGINFQNLENGEISSITRSTLKLKESDIVCITIGAYTEGKHQMAIIGIAEEILKKYKNVKFICAGPILNKKLYNQFVKNVNASKAKNNIIILTYIPQEEIGNFISINCDIYLQPSIHEAGVPLTVMEALLKGKPVVMTDFLLSKTFPKVDRILGVTPPYGDILKITSQTAAAMSKKITDSSTGEFAAKIGQLVETIQFYKDKNNFKIEDYHFLSDERMAEEYIKFIKIGQ